MTAQIRGSLNHHAGTAAEEAVERHYLAAGYGLVRRRFRGANDGRGRSGEIDLIFRNDTGLVFVEVKKSISHERAAASVSQRQIERLYKAASEFLAQESAGQETDCRFDVALVDASGAVEFLENALTA